MHKSTMNPDKVISAYLSGQSIMKIAADNKLGSNTIVNILAEGKIKRRTRSEQLRTYSIDESVFDVIDSEEKAYFLGFLYADGYNGGCKYKYKVCLSLNARDEEILHKFLALLKSDRPILYAQRPTGVICTVAFQNRRLSERLTELGCHNAKTFTLTFPEWMPEYLVPHFIRGYNDGDGWIHFKGKGVTVGAIGTIAFINRLAQKIEAYCQAHISFRPHPRSKGIISYQVRGRDQVSAVLAWLYKDATVYLLRKKRKAEAVLTPVYHTTKPNGSDCHLSVLTEGIVLEVFQLMRLGELNRKISKKTGVSIDAVNDIRIGRTWHHITGFNSRVNLGTGTPKGHTHGMSKLSEEDAKQIKLLIDQGLSNIEIASRFSVTKDMISKIRCGKNWAHVTGISFIPQGKAHRGENNATCKLTVESVLEIKRLLANGETGFQ